MRTFTTALLALTFLSASAHAEWELVDSQELKAVTPYGVHEILSRWEFRDDFEWARTEIMNQVLAGLPTMQFTAIAITTKRYHFVGESSCKPNDWRLNYKSNESTITWSNGESVSTTGSFPADQDPCAESAKK